MPTFLPLPRGGEEDVVAGDDDGLVEESGGLPPAPALEPSEFFRLNEEERWRW